MNKHGCRLLVGLVSRYLAEGTTLACTYILLCLDLRTGKMLMSAPPTNSHIPARILDLAISYFFAPPKLGYVANERVGCPRQCFREPPHQPTYQRLVGEYRTGLSFSGEFTSFVTFVPGDRGGPTLYFVQ